MRHTTAELNTILLILIGCPLLLLACFWDVSSTISTFNKYFEIVIYLLHLLFTLLYHNILKVKNVPIIPHSLNELWFQKIYKIGKQTKRKLPITPEILRQNSPTMVEKTRSSQTLFCLSQLLQVSQDGQVQDFILDRIWGIHLLNEIFSTTLRVIILLSILSSTNPPKFEEAQIDFIWREIPLIWPHLYYSRFSRLISSQWIGWRVQHMSCTYEFPQKNFG